MASNTKRRIPVKWVRDRAKAAYQKESSCYICGTDQDLELHHLYSITLLLQDWCKAKGYSIDSDDDVLRIRDDFISEHETELYNDVFTLCNKHHVRLHSIYGKIPTRITVPRQRRWINLQRDKFNGLTVEAPSKSFFSEFT